MKGEQVPQDTIDKYPSLTSEDSFYYVLRERVNEYLKANGGPGPTQQCIVLYMVTFVLWWVNFGLLYQTGKFY